MRCHYHKALWKMRIPMKVKTFIWLLLHNKLLTRAVLFVRGCSTRRVDCVMCIVGMFETREHLIWECSYARLFWRGLLPYFNFITSATNGTEFEEVWYKMRKNGGTNKQLWDFVWAECWTLWRERNKRIFSEIARIVPILIDTTVAEIHGWLTSVGSRHSTMLAAIGAS